ncbi:YheC/YheD family protein [Gorillibacterium massiliense]|uniref:YheC/YheD family protein n=1 Tax=Gorillibacterium massiliense TaxID=1280390 RepID=UPI0004AF1090|nr:YheC/YheD family protein [Gorillibacterium massiliense]
MARRSVYPNTKLGKARYLLEHSELAEHVPDTIKETSENLHQFLMKYRTVYVKPDNGTAGRGVMRVKVEDPGTYCYQLEKEEHRFSSFNRMYRSLSEITSKRRHLVQKGIPLLKIRKRPFDIRVMVQRNPEGVWETTGIIGRLAHPRKIVTNYHSGGTPLPLEALLESHMSSQELPAFLERLNNLGVLTAEHMVKGYPFVHAFGIDIGLDADLKPWIIEVNTKPDPHIFKWLGKPSVYQKILRYLRFNRRLARE